MFKIVSDLDQLTKAYLVRAMVFLEEQGRPYAVEFDENDQGALHVLGEEHGEPIAASRIRFFEGYAKFERIAVRKSYRARGVGDGLVEFMISAAKKRGYDTCLVYASSHLTGFFQKHGFASTGKDEREAGGLLKEMVRAAEKLPTELSSAAKTRPEAAHVTPMGALPSSLSAEDRPGERICPVTGQRFEVTAEDLVYYRKMQVPAPRLCPDERSLRRMAFANQRTLYHRTCSGSGKRIISNYSPDQDVPVYDIDYWYSDKWDQFSTGRDYDFSRPFFEQYAELLKVAPRPNLQRNPQFDENSDFTNYAGKNKNCYLIFDSDKNRDCYYSYSVNSCEDVVDCFRVEQCELCYECIDCTNCYGCAFLQNCDNCSNSMFLKSCIGCAECFGCVNLRNKRYYFLNEKYSKDEYERKLAGLELEKCSKLEKFRTEFLEFTKQFPQKYIQGVQNENVLGDYLTNCKNAFYCFDSRKLWDCKYITQAFDDAKDCMDCTEVGDGVELFYETCYTGYEGQFVRFTSHALGRASDLTYCYFSPHCSDCFGCVGIHHAKYVILNKPYSESEYKELVPRIIEHMKETGEWGEFFPPQLSPFPYNITHAYDYFPLTREEALRRGYTWLDKEEREYQPSSYKVPDALSEVKDDILDTVLGCEASGKNYKVQKAELAFHRKLSVPLPRLCPDERHLRRLRLRNPRTLYKRTCAVSGREILTTLSPDRPEQVVCEEEFLKLLD